MPVMGLAEGVISWEESVELAIRHGLARIATGLGISPETPEAAKHPKSGQVTASRGNSRVIFLMQ